MDVRGSVDVSNARGGRRCCGQAKEWCGVVVGVVVAVTLVDVEFSKRLVEHATKGLIGGYVPCDS